MYLPTFRARKITATASAQPHDPTRRCHLAPPKPQIMPRSAPPADLCTRSAPFKVHSLPSGRLPSSRCIRSAPIKSIPNAHHCVAGRSRYSTKPSRQFGPGRSSFGHSGLRAAGFTSGLPVTRAMGANRQTATERIRALSRVEPTEPGDGKPETLDCENADWNTITSKQGGDARALARWQR